MKFARIGDAGRERPIAMGDDGAWHELGGIVDDVSAATIAELSALTHDRLAGEAVVNVDGVRFGPPIVGVGKVVCVGLNYRDHAAETGAEIPAEPILFMKAPDTIVGPNDDVTIPRRSTKTDWEVELAVVIKDTTRYLNEPADAAAHIAGYAISHDVSEREFQLERGGQWDKGKNCETFNPLGPYLVSPDEIDDVQQLALNLSVNGESRQSGTTADMIFNVDHLVWYISQFMTLYAGDVINTGTPAGVALGRPGTPFLKAGDVTHLSIDGLGTQTQTFVDAAVEAAS